MFSGNATEYGINENPVDYVVRFVVTLSYYLTILLSYYLTGPRVLTAAEPEVQSLPIYVPA